MPEKLYGIRHHGPGSARAVVAELERERPSILLVEGPPEADDLVRWVADEGLEPPVALLGYAADDPRRSAFWPFAVFSPEWQAIRWAVTNDVPVRFFDLPYAFRLTDARTPDTPPAAGPPPNAGPEPAAKPDAEPDAEPGAERAAQPGAELAAQPGAELAAQPGADNAGPEAGDADPTARTPAPGPRPGSPADGGPRDAGPPVPGEAQPSETSAEDCGPEDAEGPAPRLRPVDPIGELARAAGYDDPERWWEDVVEHRGMPAFEAIAEAMTAIRESSPEDPEDLVREAYMRTVLREVRRTHENIAVVCGAWHVPALARKVAVKDDAALLKGRK